MNRHDRVIILFAFITVLTCVFILFCYLMTVATGSP